MYSKYLLFAFFLVVAAKTSKVQAQSTALQTIFEEAQKNPNSNSGLLIVDAETGETIFSENADKYFIPASNIKILTLFACLKTLGDSIPALKYVDHGNEIVLQGMADATFLNPLFPASPTFNFLKKYPKISFSTANFQTPVWGKGWAWDDYNDAFQTDITALPLYGNLVHVSENINVSPTFFQNNFIADGRKKEIRRDFEKNTFHFSDSSRFIAQNLPIKFNDDLTAKLLADTLKAKIEITNLPLSKNAKTLYSMPVDTVYRRMMQTSDNTLAEHLLLSVSGKLTDTLRIERAISIISEKYFSDFPQKARWVDGSGISRYNQLSPQDIVNVLDKLLHSVDKSRLFSLMAIGGGVGSLSTSYVDKTPYVFAKTGSMSGVYNQSGYLITKSGRLFIFSFLNNDFIEKLSVLKSKTNQIMMWVRENY